MSVPIVELDSVKKVYTTEEIAVTALHDVSVTIAEGEYAVIMGPSGSGKSTLLNILGCLDRVTDGRYILGGQDISQLDDNALSTIRSQKLGFIFQSYNLIAQLTGLPPLRWGMSSTPFSIDSIPDMPHLR